MPKKQTKKNTDSEKKTGKEYSVQFYLRYKDLSNIMYHRLKYEIRDDPNKKMTIAQWDKVFDKVKF